MKSKKKSVYIVYENIKDGKSFRRVIVDVFSTRKKASSYLKGKKTEMMAIAEYEIK